MSELFDHFKKEIRYNGSLLSSSLQKSEAEISEEKQSWQFYTELKQQPTSYFEPLVRKHRVLALEYRLFCRSILKAIEKNQISAEELMTALMLVEVLLEVYRRLDVPREIDQLRKEQDFFRTQLKNHHILFEDEVIKAQSRDFLTKKIRDKTVETNWHRQFIIRFKRLLDSIAVIVAQSSLYFRAMTVVDKVLGPVLSYLSWLFYVPRLAVNIFLLLIHVLPFAMNDEERALSWHVRLAAHWQRRWFQIGNDAVWMIAGLLSCFVWLGVLAPVGAYINVILYGYDFVLASISAILELRELYRLRTSLAQLKKECDSPAIDAYYKELEKQISFEQKRLLLSVLNTFLLFSAMLLCVPIITNPMIPLIGAIALVTITIAVYLQNVWLKKHCPKSSLADLSVFKKQFNAKQTPSSVKLADLAAESTIPVC